jgi:iron complex transport system ATP-binding protein
MVSCNIFPGELAVLLGANGAGKSTLLRLLSGERAPHTGRIWWGHRLLHTIAAAELARRRAVLTQHTVVTLPFTVEEIVLMGRYPHYGSAPSGKDKEIVKECLKEMQAGHLKDRIFYTLSGGEQQRVHMARVLAQLRGTRMDEGIRPGMDEVRPGLLLLDEPTSSLDWRHQQLCLQKARDLAAGGYTVMVVLHDLNLTAQFADKIILLKNGRLLAAGERDEVLQPDFIHQAYGMETQVFHPEGSPFPVIIPTTIKKEIYAND